MKTEQPPNTGYSPDHHLEPTVEADIYFDERGLQFESFQPEAVKAVAKFSARCFECGGISNQRKFFQAVHALCFAAQIHPLQRESMQVIGDGLGIGKAGFSKLVNRYRDILKLPRLSGAKSSEARKSYRTKTTQYHANRKATTSTGNNRTFSSLLGEAHQRAGI